MHTRRAWVFRLLLLPVFLAGCSDDSGNSDSNMKKTMNTDIDDLMRLIHLPADVKRCEWQTGKRALHGGDWWLAAALEVDSDRIPAFLQGIGTRTAIETPPGLELTASFAALKSLPGAQVTESGQVRLITTTYGVGPYANSPLLAGQAIRLSPSHVFVMLWTN